MRQKRETINEFFCEACKAWLREDGVIHGPDPEMSEHPQPRRFRVSHDGGATWEEV